MQHNVTLLLFPLLLLVAGAALACTGVTVKTTAGDVISARTLEFGYDLQSQVILLPRGYPMQVTLPDGRAGMKWTQQYASLGANGLHQTIIADGFNEKGLSVGIFYFPGYASYAALTPENAGRALLSIDLPGWLLGHFATVQEVKDNLDKIVVVEGSRPNVPVPMPVHYRVTDATGRVIVIEHTNGGQVKVYEDPLGVITNSPTFDWHTTNLRNYLNLTPVNKPEVDLSGTEIQQLGQGSGMHGLPGDFTPPSRFVRAVILSQSALPAKTADEGVNLAWLILSNISIPLGSVRAVQPGRETHYEYTQWTNVSDLTNHRFYYRTYGNQAIRMAGLSDLDLNAKEVLAIPMDTPPQYQNVSTQARPLS